MGEREMDDIKQALMELTVNIRHMDSKQDEMINDVKSIKEAIYNPETGLYARVRDLEQWQQNMSRVIWTVGLGSQKSRNVMKQVETIEELLEEEDLETTLAVINRLRLTLKSIDLRLADVEMISQGYLTHLEGDKNVPDRRPSVDSTGISDAITNP